MPYVGWKLPDADRAALLAQFPPAYPDVIAHHVTLQFGVKTDHPMPTATQGRVVGYADDGAGVQALVVEIDGTTVRPNGQTFHVTWSIDRAAGRKPAHSNDVLKNGFEPLATAVPITLIPKLFLE